MANIARELQNAPLPDMVQSLGVGIAKAQQALDRVSMQMAQELTTTEVEMGGSKYSLLALGFTPTFYQYTDTIIELKMSFSMQQSKEMSASAKIEGKVGFGPYAVSASVTASYSQKYQYSAEGSSYIRTKLVTVPNPPVFEQRLKALIDAEMNTLRENNYVDLT